MTMGDNGWLPKPCKPVAFGLVYGLLRMKFIDLKVLSFWKNYLTTGYLRARKKSELLYSLKGPWEWPLHYLGVSKSFLDGGRQAGMSWLVHFSFQVSRCLEILVMSSVYFLGKMSSSTPADISSISVLWQEKDQEVHGHF